VSPPTTANDVYGHRVTAVEVKGAGETLCPFCAGRLCVTANIGGNRTVGLCPTCDAANPHARQLVSYFEANGSVQAKDRSIVSELIGHWLGSLPGHRTVESTLSAQVEAWWSARSGG
jgi:hypothetical protein